MGILGEHSWQLERRKTWQDPKGENRRPPLAETDNLYLASAEAPAAAAAASTEGGDRAEAAAQAEAAEGGGAAARGGGSAGSGAGRVGGRRSSGLRGSADSSMRASSTGEQDVFKDYSPMQRAALKLEVGVLCCAVLAVFPVACRVCVCVGGMGG